MQKWAENNGITDENLLDFEQYNNDFYFDSAYRKAYSNVAELKLTEEEKDILAAMWAEFNVNYFAGTLDEFYPQMLESEGCRIMNEKGLADSWNFAYMLTAAGNGTAENNQRSWEKSFAE